VNKYLTREESLRNKFSEELTHPKPKVERLVEIANEFETDNLATIKKLTRHKKADDNKIKGALKQTIQAHGPITDVLIGSAIKRINGALLVCNTFKEPEQPKDSPYALRGLLVGAAIGIILTLLLLLTLIF